MLYVSCFLHSVSELQTLVVTLLSDIINSSSLHYADVSCCLALH